jgi:hypothetical protein
MDTDLINRIAAALTALPPKERDRFSFKEAVEMLETVIRDALSKGYDVPDVAELIRAHGVERKTATLRQYLAGTKKPKPAGKKTAPRPRDGGTPRALSARRPQQSSPQPLPGPRTTSVGLVSPSHEL